ncbi:hypothetical protein Bbelb_437790, partial [Branchiostoma belcheri]
AVLGKTWGEITPDDFHWERRLVDRIYRDVRSPRSRLSPQNASSYLRNVSGLLLVHRGNGGGRSGNEISPDDLIGDETLTTCQSPESYVGYYDRYLQVSVSSCSTMHYLCTCKDGHLLTAAAPPAQITEQLLYMYFPGGTVDLRIKWCFGATSPSVATREMFPARPNHLSWRYGVLTPFLLPVLYLREMGEVVFDAARLRSPHIARRPESIRAGINIASLIPATAPDEVLKQAGLAAREIAWVLDFFHGQHRSAALLRPTTDSPELRAVNQT